MEAETEIYIFYKFKFYDDVSCESANWILRRAETSPWNQSQTTTHLLHKSEELEQIQIKCPPKTSYLSFFFCKH